MPSKSSPSDDINNAFDELEKLLADEFEDQDDWDDDLDAFEQLTQMDSETEESTVFSNKSPAETQFSEDLFTNEPTASAAPQPKATLQAARANATIRSPAQTANMENIDNGKGLRLHLDQTMNFGSRQKIAHLLEGIRNDSAKHYDLDLNDCPKVTVSGIALLSLLIEASRSREVELTISNCQPPVYQTLCWSGINRQVLVAAR